jgi:death on curing protein
MAEWTWISPELAEAIHARQLAEHGGPTGVRDRGLLESALARPLHPVEYGGREVDIPALAAAYAFGLVRNHPFVDGNKRTAYVVCRTFLVLNGWDLVGSLAERYRLFLGLAPGEVSEDELAQWLRSHSRPLRISEVATGYTR